MILYRLRDRLLLEDSGQYYRLDETSLDSMLERAEVHEYLESVLSSGERVAAPDPSAILAPIGGQEVWAAGVTYYRSRAARMEESKVSGGGSFYDRVYTAQRPELFFKAIAPKVVGPNGAVAIRSDANWSVPEPELVLLINSAGTIVGYTIGNDMSSRDIEGENLLYLPQAKIYDRSCALGPGILFRKEHLPLETKIALRIGRGGEVVFTGATALSEMKRRPEELVEYLYRDQTFPHGCFLLTGTGIIPPDSFTLQQGDQIEISIDGIGVLANHVG